MGDMMLIMPKMADMKGILTDLTVIFKDMFLRLMLISLCSFRTPVNFIYTRLTGRSFTLSNLALIDFCMLAYCGYFISVYYTYNTTERLHSSLLEMMADEDDPFNLFALNMMFNADIKEYRFDWMSGVFAGLIILKIIMMFQYTTQFGPILKMIITMSKQMIVFTIVWGIIIILFAITGQLVFFELTDFKDLTTTFTYLLEAALGGWDVDIFLLPRKYSC
jgi:hypothetical protein